MAEQFGRYQLLELLGRGGMGEVYRAYDTSTERIVAVKVLPQDLAGDAEFERRFRREARIAAALNDPHVVPIHSYGEIEGRLYVDMRLIEGRDLSTLLRSEGGRLSPPRAIAIIEQVASALDSAHRAGLVHRDVKPSNVLVTDRGFAYLIDFGIARANADTAMTKTGHMIGTLAYMAPERFNGVTDPSGDVYALACVLYECLTGDRPYPGDSLEQQLVGHLTKPPPQPSARCPDVPTTFDGVVARGMAKAADWRYSTTAELAAAARAALTGAVVPQGPVAPHWPPAPPPNPLLDNRSAAAGQRRFWALAAGAIATVAVIVAVVIAVVVAKDEPRGTPSASPPSSSAAAASSSASLPPVELGTAAPLPKFKAPANLGADCQYPASREPAAKPVKPPRTGTVPTEPAEVSASMATSQGNIGLMLANNESPCTVNSFISLATQGFFKDTKCHRVVASPALSILQCGDPRADGTGGPGYEFANEYPTNQFPPNDPHLQAPAVYPRGTLAMAHSAQPNSNGSQFFLVYRDSTLPPDYTVFGTIQPDGLATLDKIAAGGVVGGGADGSPELTTTITSLSLD